MNGVARRLAPHLVAALALGLAACAGASDSIGSQEQSADAIDRLLIGQAVKYPADLKLRAREKILSSSMAERRKAAWDVVARALAPVELAADVRDPETGSTKKVTLPRFQTWYDARNDVGPMFKELFQGLDADQRRDRAPFGAAAIDAVFPWNAVRATSLPSFTQERLEARLRDLETEGGVHSLGKDNRVLMSPEYVAHLFDNYRRIVDCPTLATGEGIAADDASSFAPCLAREFPPSAATIKTRWMPGGAPLPTFDTSAAGLSATLERGTWAPAGEASPDAGAAYTMRLASGNEKHLVALHIVTKELRDWVWITLWWSPDPNSDFGADRPASITGAFANYKMCVVTAFDEHDAAPGSAFADKPTLAAALEAAAEHGPATWCSNPYLETEERNATTNCIGCHQHGGTGETSTSILADPKKFPDYARRRVRENFPVDYGFTTHGGLDIAATMAAIIGG